MSYSIVNKEDTRVLQPHIRGQDLLNNPLLNKSTAFTMEERSAFGLHGLLPPIVESIDQQAQRVYQQYQRYTNTQQQHSFLHELYSRNEILFYYVLRKHLPELLSIIYTPTVAQAVIEYSGRYQTPRGIYISYADRNRLEELLRAHTGAGIDLLVISDGEGVLGIGDQGIGGIEIPIAKLAMYITNGQCSPYRGLAVFLDVGTNNTKLLEDPLYLGYRKPRVKGEEYSAFVDQVVSIVDTVFPRAVIHWEDFSKINARRHLQAYCKKIPCFNDDIQGTGVVVLAAILTALRYKGETLSQQRIVIVGAGSAGVGVAKQIYAAARHYGMSKEQAQELFWLLDRYGLVLANHTHVGNDELQFARPYNEIGEWENRQLIDVVRQAQPTILIGCSTVANMFDSDILNEVCKATPRPIILPLSNPLDCAEATPQAICTASNFKAFIATGSPFPPVKDHNGALMEVSQCNNLYAFPGIGAGMIATQATELTTTMLIAAAEAISQLTADTDLGESSIMPRVTDLASVSSAVAKAVAIQSIRDKVNRQSEAQALKRLQTLSWQPEYYTYASQ
tara:strand:- start:5470 stop:7158 length:1689 start_codon:yes stop_codon:yes gene_type:complete